MGNYILPPNAQESLNGIKAYSLEKFGKRQTDIYLEKLRDRMRCLANNPKQGRCRDKIKRGIIAALRGRTRSSIKSLRITLQLLNFP